MACISSLVLKNNKTYRNTDSVLPLYREKAWLKNDGPHHGHSSPRRQTNIMSCLAVQFLLLYWQNLRAREMKITKEDGFIHGSRGKACPIILPSLLISGNRTGHLEGPVISDFIPLKGLIRKKYSISPVPGYRGAHGVHTAFTGSQDKGSWYRMKSDTDTCTLHAGIHYMEDFWA